MIKECKVINWNVLVMVVNFDGYLIQMPSTDKKEKTVFVKFENKQYFISSKDDYEKSLTKTVKKEFKKEVSEIDE